MKKLSRDQLHRAGQFIMEGGRPLERAIYRYHFEDGNPQTVIKEIKKFQNEDGGFGHGIESDFRLPDSSPMASSVGVRLLSEYDQFTEAREAIRMALHYFESSFDKKRKGWYVVPKEVNQYPHAPWWHYDDEKGMTIIDKNWGNPTAEILAYLYKYKSYTENFNLDELIEYAIKAMEEKKIFPSESEVFCYIKLYEVLSEGLKTRLETTLPGAIAQVVEYDKAKWMDYVPRPLDFVSRHNKKRFGIPISKIEEDLDFTISQLESQDSIVPPWGESYYQGDLKPAYKEWQGLWTLKALMRLDNYGRIENR